VALAYLIKYDPAGVGEEDSNGWTTLAWTLDKNSPRIVQVLVESGRVNINRKDRCGRLRGQCPSLGKPIYAMLVFTRKPLVNCL
jgi:hypothetical protein